MRCRLKPSLSQVVLADVDLDGARKSAEILKSEGFQASAVKCDVRHRADVDAAVQSAVEQFGGLDIAVANAGESLVFECIGCAAIPNSDRDTLSQGSKSGFVSHDALLGPRRSRCTSTAGIVKAAGFLEMTEQDFDDVVAVNLK